LSPLLRSKPLGPTRPTLFPSPSSSPTHLLPLRKNSATRIYACSPRLPISPDDVARLGGPSRPPPSPRSGVSGHCRNLGGWMPQFSVQGPECRRGGAGNGRDGRDGRDWRQSRASTPHAARCGVTNRLSSSVTMRCDWQRERTVPIPMSISATRALGDDKNTDTLWDRSCGCGPENFRGTIDPNCGIDPTLRVRAEPCPAFSAAGHTMYTRLNEPWDERLCRVQSCRVVLCLGCERYGRCEADVMAIEYEQIALRRAARICPYGNR
jgi:hypothetical protein